MDRNDIADMVGGLRVFRCVGHCVVLQTNLVLKNSLLPKGSRLRINDDQAAELQAVARKAMLATGEVDEQEIADRMSGFVIEPESPHPGVAEASWRAMEVLLRESPDRRSPGMNYWRGRYKARAAARARAAGEVAQAESAMPEETEGGKQNAEGGDDKVPNGTATGQNVQRREVEFRGGGLHNKKAEIANGAMFALVAAVEGTMEVVLTGAEPIDFDAKVKEAPGLGIEKLYLYQRAADDAFERINSWPRGYSPAAK